MRATCNNPQLLIRLFSSSSTYYWGSDLSRKSQTLLLLLTPPGEHKHSLVLKLQCLQHVQGSVQLNKSLGGTLDTCTDPLYWHVWIQWSVDSSLVSLSELKLKTLWTFYYNATIYKITM